MPAAAPPALIAGPYHTPRVRLGRDWDGVVLCRGPRVEPGPHPVRGLTSAPIPWPYTRCAGSHRAQLLVAGDLERAIRTESVAAVAYWWGVSTWWVNRARAALGVPRMTAGTRQLWRQLAPVRLGNPRAPGRYRPPCLSASKVALIRRLGLSGTRTAEIAERFKVTPQYVRMIMVGRRRREGSPTREVSQ